MNISTSTMLYKQTPRNSIHLNKRQTRTHIGTWWECICSFREPPKPGAVLLISSLARVSPWAKARLIGLSPGPVTAGPNLRLGSKCATNYRVLFIHGIWHVETCWNMLKPPHLGRFHEGTHNRMETAMISTYIQAPCGDLRGTAKFQQVLALKVGSDRSWDPTEASGNQIWQWN